MIDLQPSSEQIQIIDSVAGYLQREFPIERLQPHASGGSTVRSAWRELAAQGFFALAVAEEVGGAGFSAAEEMLVHRAFAGMLMSPSVLAAAMAVHLLVDAGLGKRAGAIAAGEQPVAIGLARGPVGIGAEIDGELHLVDASPGDLIFLFASDRIALFERDRLDGVIEVEAIDETVTLHRGRAQRVVPLATSDSRDLLRRTVLLLAASLTGIAESARDIAVAHAGIREQFGKPIGSFQGVAHHCADMEVRARAARAETAFAAIALRDGRTDADFHVPAAALVAADAAIRNSTMAIRVLGGMGFTAECALHHYLKRAHLYARMAGGARALEADILRQPTDRIIAGT